jgi:hypothetical protein
MAALFPEGVEVVGPLADDGHYWNDYRRKAAEWGELGLQVSLRIAPYAELDFSHYDLLVESVETFHYSRDWANHCHRRGCPVLLKACWTRAPRDLLPRQYVRKTRHFPLLLEMPAHARAWRRAGFSDVNVIPNPVGEWWFEREWTGENGQMLFVLSGTKDWRGDPSWYGFEIWNELCRRFPGRGHHHDGHVAYKTSRALTELYAASRVFVNLDRPFGQGERPLTLAFTEALSAGLPVVARDLPGLSYRTLIDGNGICTNDVDEMADYIERCLGDLAFARRAGERSREIARENFSLAAVRPRYDAIIERARAEFARGPRPPSFVDRIASLLDIR